MFLDEEIKKVTPKPQVVKDEEAIPLDLSGNDKKQEAPEKNESDPQGAYV